MRRTRTLAAVPIEVPILDVDDAPEYQRITAAAARLAELGLSQSEIGRRLEVDRWTVGKALRWLRAPNARH
jgi:hypothetical protein